MATSLMMAGSATNNSALSSPSWTNTSTSPSAGMTSPAVRFTTVEELFRKIEHTSGDFLSVHGRQCLSRERLSSLTKYHRRLCPDVCRYHEQERQM